MCAPGKGAPGLDVLRHRLVGDVQERLIDPASFDEMPLEIAEKGLQRHAGRTRRCLERVGPRPRLGAAPQVHQFHVAQAPRPKQPHPAVETTVIEPVVAIGSLAHEHQIQIGLEHGLAMRPHVVGVRPEEIPVLFAPFLDVALRRDALRAEPVGHP